LLIRGILTGTGFPRGFDEAHLVKKHLTELLGGVHIELGSGKSLNAPLLVRHFAPEQLGELMQSSGVHPHPLAFQVDQDRH